MTNRCPETQDGHQCVLQAGHEGVHRATWAGPELTAERMPESQKFALLVFALIAIVIVIGVYLYIKGGLDAML